MYNYFVKVNKLIWIIPFLLIATYLGLSLLIGKLYLPGVTIYRTYPNTFGGCFNICNGNEKVLHCRKTSHGAMEPLISCTYSCVGIVTNNCM